MYIDIYILDCLLYVYKYIYIYMYMILIDGNLLTETGCSPEAARPWSSPTTITLTFTNEIHVTFTIAITSTCIIRWVS